MNQTALEIVMTAMTVFALSALSAVFNPSRMKRLGQVAADNLAAFLKEALASQPQVGQSDTDMSAGYVSLLARMLTLLSTGLLAFTIVCVTGLMTSAYLVFDEIVAPSEGSVWLGVNSLWVIGYLVASVTLLVGLRRETDLDGKDSKS